MIVAGLSLRSPQPDASSAMLAILLSFDLPYPLAQAAAARHLQDVNAALDSACSSERRHTHARNAEDRIDLTTRGLLAPCARRAAFLSQCHLPGATLSFHMRPH